MSQNYQGSLIFKNTVMKKLQSLDSFSTLSRTELKTINGGNEIGGGSKCLVKCTSDSDCGGTGHNCKKCLSGYPIFREKRCQTA